MDWMYVPDERGTNDRHDDSQIIVDALNSDGGYRGVSCLAQQSS